MRVFISHASADKPAVLQLAEALAARGFEPWVDAWEIAGGQDIVARINDGLAQADAGLIVFSAAAEASRWVQAEWSALTFSRIEHGQVLVPVMLGDAVAVPPLLAPALRRHIDDVQGIEDALRGRARRRPDGQPAPEAGRAERVRLLLRRTGGAAVEASVHHGQRLLGRARHEHGVPAALQAAQARFLSGFGQGHRRDGTAPAASASEAQMAELGRLLAAFCLPEGSAAALQALIDGLPLGARLELCVQADDAALLGLPFEALRLPDGPGAAGGRLLATQPAVLLWRQPLAPLLPKPLAPQPAPAGPLKLLVAVGAPDEGPAAPVVLDQERELQNILDAVEPLNRLDNAQVRVLEVGHPAQIAAAFGRDAYHVLHLSCHGLPGALELEDEDGHAVRVKPEDLIAPLRTAGRPLPLVLLNCCHGGVAPGAGEGTAASFALALLRAGVPAVVAMQTAVTDGYASALAGAFYRGLAEGEHLRPSRALARARQALEAARQQALRAGEAPPPEYATATLFLATDDDGPVADFGADARPLTVAPVLKVGGPVPQLRIDDLIGRRAELRAVLRTLRDPAAAVAGVVVTGIGGVGKSALAGRAIARLAEDGWRVAAHVGRYSLADLLAAAAAAALQSAPAQQARQLGAQMAADDLDDADRERLLHQALAEQPLLLVLDDFEQNLSTGGESFLNPDTAAALQALCRHAGRGRLLLTCRHPLPGLDGLLRRVALGPLGPAELRKLLLRLPALQALADDELGPVLRRIGGHPRMLEFVDALVRGGQGRLPHVTRKLRELAALAPAQGGEAATPGADASPIDPQASAGDLADSAQAAQWLMARNVLLDELLALAEARGAREVLLQLAASNLPVPPGGLARMLSDDPAQPGDAAAAAQAIDALEDLSLLYRLPDGSAAVHRWTAQGLAAADPTAQALRCVRAGRYRWWRVEHETHDLADAVEAVRNHLAGENFDWAAEIARPCLDALARFQRTRDIATLASEWLETLPNSHVNFAPLADREARAHQALGDTARALVRYTSLLEQKQRAADEEPDSAHDQRELSVALNKMGDMYVALGQADAAREAYGKALAIAQGLAKAEPDRADYQRDLSVSYERMGDWYVALGQGDAAREVYGKALAIRQGLVQAEPDREDYQRGLSVSYEKMGDVYVALGQGTAAREAFGKSLATRQGLAEAEPDRADYLRDLSVSCTKLGRLLLGHGDVAGARRMYEQDLAIAERLARDEPDRADLQRDLIVSLWQTSKLPGTDQRALLNRAIELARHLADGGRLNPADAGMPGALSAALVELDASDSNPETTPPTGWWRRNLARVAHWLRPGAGR